MSRTVHVALIGAGSDVAPDHHQAFAALDDVVVVAGVDPDGAVRARVAAAWGTPVYASVRELLASRTRVDLAVVCVRDPLHVSVATETLRAGWHTLVEKPLALSHADAQSLFRLAADRRLYLGVGLQRAYMAPELSELTHTRAYGETREVHVWWLRYDGAPRWRQRLTGARGGALADLGVHLLCQADALLAAADPVLVTTRVSRPGPDRVETRAQVLIDYDTNARLGLTVAWDDLFTAGEDTGMRVIWAGGGAHARLLTIETAAEAQLRPPVVCVRAPDGRQTSRLSRLLTVPECHLALAGHVVTAVRRGGPAPEPEVRHELRLVRLLDAAYASAEAGGETIALTTGARRRALPWHWSRGGTHGVHFPGRCARPRHQDR